MAQETVRCSSCGSDAADVISVRRVYVTPAAWDTEERIEVVDEVEHWCFPCRTHYPHEEVGGGGGSAPGPVGDPA